MKVAKELRIRMSGDKKYVILEAPDNNCDQCGSHVKLRLSRDSLRRVILDLEDYIQVVRPVDHQWLKSMTRKFDTQGRVCAPGVPSKTGSAESLREWYSMAMIEYNDWMRSKFTDAEMSLIQSLVGGKAFSDMAKEEGRHPQTMRAREQKIRRKVQHYNVRNGKRIPSSPKVMHGPA